MKDFDSGINHGAWLAWAYRARDWSRGEGETFRRMLVSFISAIAFRIRFTIFHFFSVFISIAIADYILIDK